MSYKWLIEEIQEKDKENVRQLLIDSYGQYGKEFADQEAWLEYITSIKKSVDNEQIDRILVAKRDQSIVGTLQIFDTSEKAYGRPELNISSSIVRLLAVHPDARGQGVAQALLEASIHYAKEKGEKSLYLHSSDLMNKAIRLYEWIGFKRDETKEFYNREVLVKCYRYDIEKEGETHGSNPFRSRVNFNTPSSSSASRAVK
ncbi:GNAT family N-acetyltransferase [Niallia nealsonii]|uniref:N-acetyltransferase n=1 Tax=Niallia nealsonii TaxID=115979 RepID=A0A2N0Z1B7_9BACI|nr:GNAT family N-acetyltransferase [Niallia nealsonii]PKG23304.1 N-acetyltransferase [Niallia nealsonii]